MADREHVRAKWNQRHATDPERFRTPDEFLVRSYQEFVAPAAGAPGEALDLAGGPGRHAIYLAEQGWHVTLVDISEIAVEQARRRAVERGLEIAAQVGESGSFEFGRNRFDLVVVFYFLERELFPSLFAALRPGGFLVYKTHTVEQLKAGTGPTDVAHLLQHNELLWAFAQMHILHYRETTGERATAELVARRK